MRQKDLGKTGIRVSEYGLGTWAMGGGAYGVVEDAESIRTIHRAQELGVNFIDTAPMYSDGGVDGRSERVLGQALEGRRDQWVLATKFGRSLQKKNDGSVTIVEDYSANRAVESVEQSLKRLKTDYIDVFFVHTPTPDIGIFQPEESFGAMMKLKEQGKIRTVGFSFHHHTSTWIKQVEPFLRDGSLEVLQVAVSLLMQEPLENLFPILNETGTGVVAREALATGFLTDSFTANGPFHEGDGKANMPKAELQAKLDHADRYKFLLEHSSGLNSLPEAALNWVVSHPQVSTVIPGSKNVAEIEQCLSAVEAEYFDAEIIKETQAIYGEFNS